MNMRWSWDRKSYSNNGSCRAMKKNKASRFLYRDHYGWGSKLAKNELVQTTIEWYTDGGFFEHVLDIKLKSGEK